MAIDRATTERDLIDGLVASAAVLSAHRVAYAVIGGMATTFRTQPRFTKDLDFLLHVPQLQLPAVLDALQEREFACDPLATIREWTQHHMTTLSFRGLRVDWLKPVLPAYQHVLDRATEEFRLGPPIRVASPEGLILLKLLAWRDQDQTDVKNLVTDYRDTLDLDWIRSEWATLADPADPRLARLAELVAGRREQRPMERE
jgi:hypothetical protein